MKLLKSASLSILVLFSSFTRVSAETVPENVLAAANEGGGLSSLTDFEIYLIIVLFAIVLVVLAAAVVTIVSSLIKKTRKTSANIASEVTDK